MGLLSAEDLVSRVRRGAGNPDTTDVTNAEILEFLNEAQLRFCNKYYHTEYSKQLTVTTSDGTAEYSLSQTYHIVAIRNVKNYTSGYDLRQMDRVDYDLFSLNTSSGAPTHYMASDIQTVTSLQQGSYKKITFFPTPDGTYTIYVRCDVAPDPIVLETTPNYSALGPQWDKPLIYAATADVWAFRSEFDKSAAWGQMASGAEAEAARMSMTPTEVNPSFGRILRGGFGGC